MNRQTIFRRIFSPGVVSLGYVGVCCCWILFSDRLLAFVPADSGLFALMQTFGDWFFVVATGVFIFVSMRKIVGRAENELARLRAVIDHSPASVAMTDPQGRFVMVNKEFERRYGVNSQAVLGKTVEELFPEPISENVADRVRQVLETGDVSKMDMSLSFADGTEHTLEITRFPILEPSGEHLGIGSISIDVTERTRVERELRESESLLRAIIDNCPLIIALKDLDGCYQLANKQAQETSFLYPGDIYGKTIFDFRSREEAESSTAHDREIAETREPHTYEVWNRLADGDDHHFLVTKFPVFDGNGAMTGIGVASLETTEMKNAEEALKESEALFRTVIDNSPLSIGLKDLEGRYRLINRGYREFIGADGDEYRGKTVADYRSAEFTEETEKRDREVLARRRPITYEISTINRNGETHHYLVNRFPVFDTQGEISGTGFTSLDVTERFDTERRLREMQSDFAHVSRLSTLGEMAAGFAHELNQPLAAIRNYAAGSIRRMDAEQGDINDIRVAIGHIAEQAGRAGDIIMRIRKFIRKEESEKSDIDIAAVIRDSAGLLHGEALKHDAEITLELPDDLPLVVADAVQIQQVVINLARNGMEAMEKSDSTLRRVTVRAEKVVDGVAVQIEDTGSGISNEVRDRLFEPFFTTKNDGMGIGLLICRTIIEEHHGTLEVAQAPAGGTVVFFTLPITSGK